MALRIVERVKPRGIEAGEGFNLKKSGKLSFYAGTVRKHEFPDWVEVYYDNERKQVGIKPTRIKTKSAIPVKRSAPVTCIYISSLAKLVLRPGEESVEFYPDGNLGDILLFSAE
jgi:hypothetical protein